MGHLGQWICWQVNLKVELKVFNILGMEVKTLVNASREAGTYTAELSSANLASGVYFYSLRVGDYSNTKKMIILR